MNAITSGAATLLAGAVTLSAIHFKGNKAYPNCLNELSDPAKKALKEVCSGPNPSGPKLEVSKRDLFSIFRNSRQLVMMTNRARLGHLSDEELASLLELLQEDHARLRWLLFIAVIEAIVDRLGFCSVTHYTREVLWTYGDELDLLEQISKIFGTMEGSAARANL